MQNRLFSIFVVLAASLVCAAYSNHFHNSLHFDDFHTVSDNVHIRSLGNVGRFFTDVTTFSTLPTHQVYRPLVTTSLAFDYWLGGGLNPVAFHASTYFWFSALLVCVYLLFLSLLSGDRWWALFGAALYGLHPVAAETVNYIIQRGDLYSTLGVVAALVVYVYMPTQRRFGLYLLLFAAAALSKPPALVFPALLFVFEWARTDSPAKAIRSAVPSIALTVPLALLLGRMTAATFNPGSADRAAYWWTQTWVTTEYFGAFFWPAHLSADRGGSLLYGFPTQIWVGVAFCLSLLAAIVWLWRRKQYRPAAFGLAWFVITLLPTALTPLAEASNDHRMFFAFIGLALAPSTIGKNLLQTTNTMRVRFVTASVCLLLLASATATYARNRVWQSEETLWHDVTLKNPENGRGWMNYGLTLMSRGDFANALDCFERAQKLTPTYPLVAVNLGIALGGLGRHPEAELQFRRALSLDSSQGATHSYFGRWLLEQRRYAEAIEQYQKALTINPVDLFSYHGLMRAYFDQQNWSALRPLVERVRQMDASDAEANTYLAKLNTLDADTSKQRNAVASAPTPEGFLDLSLLAYRAGKFKDCIMEAKKAIQLRPNYGDAYNNVAACHNALGQWAEGVAAAQEAVRLNPSSELARNNLAWGISQRDKVGSSERQQR